MSDELLDALAEHGVDVDEEVAEKYERFLRLRYQIVMRPGRRDNKMLNMALRNVAAKSAVEFGQEHAVRYADGVGQLLKGTWEQLHRIPVGQRGQAWGDAHSIIRAVAIEQALIESGLANELFRQGIRHQAETERLAKRAGKSGLKAAAKMGFRKRREQKAKDRKAIKDAGKQES